MAVNYTASAVGKFLHQLIHLDTNFKKLDVPISPVSFTSAFVKDWGISLVILAAFLLVILVLALAFSFIMTCICNCNCCYGTISAEDFGHGSTAEVKSRRRRVSTASVVFVLFSALVVFVAVALGIYYSAAGSSGVKKLSSGLSNSYDVYKGVANAGTGMVKSAANCTTIVDSILTRFPQMSLSVRNALTTIRAYTAGSSADSSKYESQIKSADFGSVVTFLNSLDSRRLIIAVSVLAFLAAVAGFLVSTSFSCICNCCVSRDESLRSDKCCNCSCKCFLWTLLYIFVAIILTICALASGILFAGSVGTADICMNPSAWTKALTNIDPKPNTNATMMQQMTVYFVDCTTGSKNPFSPPLQDASNKLTLAASDILNLVQFAQTQDPNLVDPLNGLYDQVVVTRDAANTLISRLDCKPVNKQITQSFDGLCGSVLTSLFALAVAIFASLFFIVSSRPCIKVVTFYRDHEKGDVDDDELDHSNAAESFL